VNFTAAPETKPPAEVDDVIFKSVGYRLQHKEKELLLDSWNVWCVHGADVVN
jgi:hypothetical protein